jgi:hypothetical protein
LLARADARIGSIQRVRLLRPLRTSRAIVEDNKGVVTLGALQQEKRDAILTLGQKHGARSIRVFGSVARGDNRETSDVDFLVEFEKGRNLFDLIGLRLDLCDLLGVEVDIVTPNSLRRLRDGVLAEAKAI